MSELRKEEDFKFTPFPRLPIELRQEIWRYILPEARVVEIRWNEKTNKYFTTATLSDEPIFKTCRDSRNYALSKYTLLEFQNDIDVDIYEDDITGKWRGIDEEYDEYSVYSPHSVHEHNTTEYEVEDSEAENEGAPSAQKQDTPEAAAPAVDATEDINYTKDSKEDDELVEVPSFSIRVDFSRDVLYFSSAHLCRKRHLNSEGFPTMAPALHALLWRLSKIPNISPKINTVAFEARFTNAFLVGPPLFELENLKSIILVEGDSCCKGYRSGVDCSHTKRKLVLLSGGLGDDYRHRTTKWPFEQYKSLHEYTPKTHHFKHKMEEEVMNYKISLGNIDSSSVEEWDNLKITIKFIKRQYEKNMRRAEDESDAGSSVSSEVPDFPPNFWDNPSSSDDGHDSQHEPMEPAVL
jgi:hypothetical protein